jgi:hypothetical protein
VFAIYLATSLLSAQLREEVSTNRINHDAAMGEIWDKRAIVLDLGFSIIFHGEELLVAWECGPRMQFVNRH